MAVERGLPQLGADDLAEMASVLKQMEAASAAGEVVDLIRLDRRFHFAVFQAARMPHLTRVISLTWDQSDPYRAAFFSDPDCRTRNNAEHRKIMTAVRKRDVVRLATLLDQHRLGPANRLGQLIEAQESSA